MAANREVVTLQIGHYANFVGTHLWNAQESLFAYNDADSQKVQLDHDVLFRSGETLHVCGRWAVRESRPNGKAD